MKAPSYSTQILALISLILSVVISPGSTTKSELILSASPSVWHEGDHQNIKLTMRYWGNLKGENLTNKELEQTNEVKEFTHKVRSFKNTLKIGSHQLKPMSLNFQEQHYSSNRLTVKVLPRVNDYRGIKFYSAQSSSPVNQAFQLVIYEYRDSRDQMHELKIKPSDFYEVYPHGGYTHTKLTKDKKKVWVQMRHFTIKFSKIGTHTLDSSILKNNEALSLPPLVLTTTKVSVKKAILPNFSQAFPNENFLSKDKLRHVETYTFATNLEFKQAREQFTQFLGAGWKLQEQDFDPNKDLDKKHLHGINMNFKGNLIFVNPAFPKLFLGLSQIEMDDLIFDKKYILTISTIRNI